MAVLALAPRGWAAPLTVHAAVLSDPEDGAVGASNARQVSAMLRSSAGYDTIDNAILEGRLGESPEALFRRCWNDVRCWREAGLAAGVEQVVLVEAVDDITLGVRVVDVVVDGPIRMGALGHAAGRIDTVALDRFFFEPGSLVVRGAVPGTRVVLDGRFEFTAGEELSLGVLASGKHSLEMEAPGYAPLFATFMVYPGQTTTISGRLAPLDPPRQRIRRWTTWWAVGLAAGGGAALARGLLSDGVAVRP
jgi:hypothetical protein